MYTIEPWGQPGLPQLDTDSNWTAFILNNNPAAHLNLSRRRKQVTLCMQKIKVVHFKGIMCSRHTCRHFSCAEESSRVKLRQRAHAALSAIKAFRWAEGKEHSTAATNKVLSPRYYHITKRREACTSGKNDCPSDQNSTCEAPAITRVVTEATRVTVASVHQALAFNYGLDESPNPRHKLYRKKELNTENKQSRKQKRKRGERARFQRSS